MPAVRVKMVWRLNKVTSTAMENMTSGGGEQEMTQIRAIVMTDRATVTPRAGGVYIVLSEVCTCREFSWISLLIRREVKRISQMAQIGKEC